MLNRKFTPHKCNAGNSCNKSQHRNVSCLEPIFALSFFQNYLQGTNTDDKQRKCEPIHFSCPHFFMRFFHISKRKNCCKNTERNIDIKYPLPGKIIRDPSAKSWTNGRANDYAHSINRICKT